MSVGMKAEMVELAAFRALRDVEAGLGVAPEDVALLARAMELYGRTRQIGRFAAVRERLAKVAPDHLALAWPYTEADCIRAAGILNLMGADGRRLLARARELVRQKGVCSSVLFVRRMNLSVERAIALSDLLRREPGLLKDDAAEAHPHAVACAGDCIVRLPWRDRLRFAWSNLLGRVSDRLWVWQERGRRRIGILRELEDFRTAAAEAAKLG